MVASGATPVVPSSSSVAAITLATSVPWEMAGRGDGLDAAAVAAAPALGDPVPEVEVVGLVDAGGVGVVGDGLPHPGVDHGHGAARAPVVVVVGREHVGAGPGLEVPADRGVAGLDPPDPVRLGEGHPRPVGQPAGGGADVGALVELDHPGPAVPGQHPPVDRGRGRAPALLPRPASNPTSTRPGTNEPAPAGMGPLTGRVDEPGGGVLRLSTAPAGAARAATGSADSRTASSRHAGERGPTGQTHGRWRPCSRRGPILLTGSTGTRGSLPRGARKAGEASRPGTSGSTVLAQAVMPPPRCLAVENPDCLSRASASAERTPVLQ